MNCKKCGELLDTNAKFCNNCGTPTGEVINTVKKEDDNIQLENVVYQNNYTQTNNNKLIIIISLIVIIGIIAVFSIIFIPKLFEKNNTQTTANNNEVTSTYKIVFNNYTFTIPEDYIYEITDDSFLIEKKDRTFKSQFWFVNGTFNQLKANRSALQSKFQQNGFNAKAAELKTIGRDEVVTIELEMAGKNVLGAYIKIDSMNFMWVSIMNQNNTIDYDLLNSVVPIVVNATSNNGANSIEKSDFSFNISDISNLDQ